MLLFFQSSYKTYYKTIEKIALAYVIIRSRTVTTCKSPRRSSFIYGGYSFFSSHRFGCTVISRREIQRDHCSYTLSLTHTLFFSCQSTLWIRRNHTTRKLVGSIFFLEILFVVIRCVSLYLNLHSFLWPCARACVFFFLFFVHLPTVKIYAFGLFFFFLSLSLFSANVCA